jgi:hypothetical protein
VLDALFPGVLGGTCAIPGAFGCGKTVISQVGSHLVGLLIFYWCIYALNNALSIFERVHVIS